MFKNKKMTSLLNILLILMILQIWLSYKNTFSLIIAICTLIILVYNGFIVRKENLNQYSSLISIINNYNSGVIKVNYKTNKILFINNRAIKDFELNNIKKNKLSIEDIMSIDYWEFINKQLDFHDSKSEYQFKFKDKIYEIVLQRNIYNKNSNIVVTFNDISKQKNYENKLNDFMNNLESKVDERTKTLQKFKDMVLTIRNFKNIYTYSEEEFLSRIFNISYELFENADLGSVYIFKSGIVYFISTKGHNCNGLNKAKLSVLDFGFTTTGVKFTKNLSEKNIEIIKKSENNINENELEIYMESVIPLCESMTMGLLFNDKLVGGLSLDISEKSGNSFTDNDKELFEVLKDLINSNYNNFKNQKFLEKFMMDEKKELEKEISIDNLTGLYNKKYFYIYFEKIWKDLLKNDLENNDTQISELMIDIDNFKNYNDKYGHLKGDIALNAVATAILSVITRNDDLVARYGGEEFIAILPQTNVNEAMIVGENIRVAVQKLQIENFVSENQKILTVSIGVSSIIPKEENSIEAVIDEADKALYISKDSGRNTVSKFN